MNFSFPIEDVSIKVVDRLPEFRDPSYTDSFAKVNNERFFLHVPYTGDFMVLKGKEILIQPDPKADQNTIELYLNGTVLGMTLHQRGIMPLHASSLSADGQGIALCGDSGAGKSTLNYGLCRKAGWSFLTDDITPFKVNGDICILPLSDRLKMWEDTIEHFKLVKPSDKRVREDIEKYFINAGEKHAGSHETTLRLLIFIEKTEQKQKDRFIEVKGSDKFELFYKNIYRNEYLNGMEELRLSYFTSISRICNNIPMYRYHRHDNNSIRTSIDELEDFVRKMLLD